MTVNLALIKIDIILIPICDAETEEVGIVEHTGGRDDFMCA